MGQPFSEKERERIRGRLLEEGRRLITEAGIRRTAVDDVTDAVGIAKGSFYRFFPTKIELCMELIKEEESGKWSLLEEIPARGADARGTDEVERFFQRARNLIEGSELVHSIYRRGEFELLLRGMSREQREENRRGDDGFSRALIRKWKEAGTRVSVEPETLTALLRCLFFASLHGEEIGDGWNGAKELLYRALAAAVREGRGER